MICSGVLAAILCLWTVVAHAVTLHVTDDASTLKALPNLPYRSKLWAALGRTSDGLTTLMVERYAGGMSQRDIESALEKALGQFVLFSACSLEPLG
jgi:hypothetical protein